MPYDPDKHHRRSIRLPEYDYTWPGGYFVTICAHNRQCVFGEIADGDMRLNRAGNIVRECWERIPGHFPGVMLDEYAVMPNHFHGIIIVAPHAPPHPRRGTACCAPTTKRRFGSMVAGSLSAIIRSFKSAVAKRVNNSHCVAEMPLWQRNYYERVIRATEELNAIREYIRLNPVMWEDDEENPALRP